MDMILIENINKKLFKAEKETNELYNKLELEKDFNEWFNQLDKETKLEIYKNYQLNNFEFDN